MLIDESYFTGPLAIAQRGQQSVVDNLDTFINRWEPVIMEAALGYDFYMAFLAGLDVGSDESTEQRWLDLLNGVVFASTSGRRTRWVGFAGGENTQTVIAATRPNLTIYAGITPGFPVDGHTYTNPTLEGWNFDLELFGAGTLDPISDWQPKAGGGIELTDTTYQTQYNERWVIHFTSKKVAAIQSGTQNLLSPLAGFIYYEYMRDLVTQNTGIGVVKAKSENSETADAGQKMVDAYNTACGQMAVLAELLRADQNKPAEDRTYPEFDYRQVGGYYGYYCGWAGYWSDCSELYSFRSINTFGI